MFGNELPCLVDRVVREPVKGAAQHQLVVPAVVLRDRLELERRFTADAAHELRTPLAALKTQAQVAQGARTPEERAHALDQVVRGTDRMTRLVGQLLTLARIEPDATEELTTVDLAAVIDEVNRIGKNRLVFAGLWTSVCIVGPALSALDQGFEAYVIADACGDVSEEAHERAMDRMVQAGVRPMTSLQYMLELQRDWARTETYDMTTGIAKKYGGAYGLGIIYAKSMFGASEGAHDSSAVAAE